MSNEPEMSKLAAENRRLREENEGLRRAIHLMSDQDFPINREEILAQIGRSPSFLEFLDSLQTREAS